MQDLKDQDFRVLADSRIFFQALATYLKTFLDSALEDAPGQEVSGVLIGTHLPGLLGRVLVPVLARDLAGPAGRTPGCVNEYRFSGTHADHAPFFTTLTMKALVSGILVFGSPVEGVSRLALSPPCFGWTHPKHQGRPT